MPRHTGRATAVGHPSHGCIEVKDYVTDISRFDCNLAATPLGLCVRPIPYPVAVWSGAPSTGGGGRIVGRAGIVAHLGQHPFLYAAPGPPGRRDHADQRRRPGLPASAAGSV